MPELHGRVRIGDVVFDPDTGELAGPRGTVRLQPQPGLVLRTLVARAGQLVTREELKRVVWPDTVVEADQGLNYCVRQIRAALGDEAESSRFIETLPRRGYRFIGSVSPLAPAPIPAIGTTTSHATPRAWRVRGRGLTAAVVSAAIVIAATMLVLATSTPTPAPQARTVAVLPLDTPNGGEWAARINQQVGDRLIELLTNSESPRWNVVGPVTTGRYATDPRPHTELGALLGVAYVVSGGVRLADSTLFVQAVRARDGTHVFAWRGTTAGRSTDSVIGDIAVALARSADSW